MSYINEVKSALRGTARIVDEKALCNLFARAEKDDLVVNVMMVGGRRSGKTSVLAAMKDNFERCFSQSNIVINPADTDTVFALEAKQREIAAYFAGRGKSRIFIPDDNPTLEINEYCFNISIKTKNMAKICLNFIDYPGEWLAQKDKYELLIKLMKKCNVILVAIDTPYLMEETHSGKVEAIGDYNDYKNYSSRIAVMLKESFELGENRLPKMVLFVPLKCEKYKGEKMQEVNAKIKIAYNETFNFLAGHNSKYCQLAITPIFTMGCASFSRFETRDDGTYVVDKDHIPQALYMFDAQADKPEPKFCEQPLVYVLTYLFERARLATERKKAGQNWFEDIWDLFAENFFNRPSSRDFLAEKDTIMHNLKDNGEGYEIVQNPLGFHRW